MQYLRMQWPNIYVDGNNESNSDEKKKNEQKEEKECLENDVITVIETVNHFISVLNSEKFTKRRTGEDTILIKM